MRKQRSQLFFDATGPDGFTASSRFHIVKTSAIRVFCSNALPRNNELAAGEPSRQYMGGAKRLSTRFSAVS